LIHHWQQQQQLKYIRSNEIFAVFEFPAIFFPFGVNGAILMVAAMALIVSKAGRKRAPTALAATTAAAQLALVVVVSSCISLPRAG
jgi:hypothetical protein